MYNFLFNITVLLVPILHEHLIGFQKVTNAAFEKLLPKGSEKAPSQVYCPLTNISYCEFTEHNKQVRFFWLYFS